MKYKHHLSGILCCLLCSTSMLADARDPEITDEAAADLAQELTNPMADLVTLPTQITYDQNIGPTDQGTRTQANVQPVYPFHLSEEWNLISRTIIPIIYQEDVFPDAGSQSGLGDISVHLFASPKTLIADKWIWGAGPVFYLPTATDSLLGAKKWGIGPTVILLTMNGPFTYGTLGNHIWSYAGDSDRENLNNSFLQPFVAYTTSDAWTFSVSSESTYNWNINEWAVPVHASASKLVFLGKLPCSLQAGVGYWLTAPDAAAEGWRFRIQVNFVMPKSALSNR